MNALIVPWSYKFHSACGRPNYNDGRHLYLRSPSMACYYARCEELKAVSLFKLGHSTKPSPAIPFLSYFGHIHKVEAWYSYKEYVPAKPVLIALLQGLETNVSTGGLPKSQCLVPCPMCNLCKSRVSKSLSPPRPRIQRVRLVGI